MVLLFCSSFTYHWICYWHLFPNRCFDSLPALTASTSRNSRVCSVFCSCFSHMNILDTIAVTIGSQIDTNCGAPSRGPSMFTLSILSVHSVDQVLRVWPSLQGWPMVDHASDDDGVIPAHRLPQELFWRGIVQDRHLTSYIHPKVPSSFAQSFERRSSSSNSDRWTFRCTPSSDFHRHRFLVEFHATSKYLIMKVAVALDFLAGAHMESCRLHVSQMPPLRVAELRQCSQQCYSEHFGGI
mmetsp:Transcript_15594/g.26126  ORF Transcript_15594/g.26126 Transcript_15594/m.26126 type:complete len:240 (-) Transcript_15594:280-999(-)